MDVAYDHIQEEALPDTEDHSDTAAVDPSSPVGDNSTEASHNRTRSNDLGTEFRETYQSLASSAWGMKLGGLWGTVRKQGESYYEGARKEFAAASSGSGKGLQGLINNTGSLSVETKDSAEGTDSTKEQGEGTPAAKNLQQPESLPADIVKEAQSMLSRFQLSATDRLKALQKAEDAADEALSKFGNNVKDFFRDAVIITSPDGAETDGSEVLFESKAADGRRVVHATRFDAQLHVIHTTLASFTQDPASDEYGKWKQDFDVEKKTGDIAKDLERYETLRASMEQLVPEQVEYKDFWCRYYFLRHVIETEEAKRRELLGKAAKGGAADDEEIGWGDEDDEEGAKASTPTNATAEKEKRSQDHLKPLEGRRSNENSVADSDTSYDVVSRATSGGPGSPKETSHPKEKGDDSDDDWE